MTSSIEQTSTTIAQVREALIEAAADRYADRRTLRRFLDVYIVYTNEHDELDDPDTQDAFFERLDQPEGKFAEYTLDSLIQRYDHLNGEGGRFMPVQWMLDAEIIEGSVAEPSHESDR